MNQQELARCNELLKEFRTDGVASVGSHNEIHDITTVIPGKGILHVHILLYKYREAQPEHAFDRMNDELGVANVNIEYAEEGKPVETQRWGLIDGMYKISDDLFLWLKKYGLEEYDQPIKTILDEYIPHMIHPAELTKVSTIPVIPNTEEQP